MEEHAEIGEPDPARIRQRFTRVKWLTAALLTGGFILSFVSLKVFGGMGVVVSTTATGIQVVAGAIFARLKGRSGWWGLFAVTGVLGLVILFNLEKKCHRCSLQGSSTLTTCTRCGAPM